MVIKRKSTTTTTNPSSNQPKKQQKKQELIEDDEDPISTLIEPFTKEQLTTILIEAAEIHPDVASRVRELAETDVVHRKIFVRGLGWDTNTDTLRSEFEKYGEIEDCKAVMDKLMGKSKGYGFVLFKTRAGAKKALRDPQKVVSGRTWCCQLATVGPVAAGSSGTAVGATGKIFVTNVGPDMEAEKVKAFFSRYGEIEEGPMGADRSSGKFKGFCFIVYKSVESAKKALEEPIKKFEGVNLNCKWAVDGPKAGKAVDVGGNLGGAGRGGFAGPIGGTNAGSFGFNPVLGQALTSLLTSSQGTGLGLNSFMGQGSVYGGSSGIGSGIGGSGGYRGLQSSYPSQQMGRGGPSRLHYGYSGLPYGGGL